MAGHGVQRAASLPLGFVPAIDALIAASPPEVDARHKEGMTKVGKRASSRSRAFGLPPAAVQPQPLIGIFADPTLDHGRDRLHGSLNVDLPGGIAHRL